MPFSFRQRVALAKGHGARRLQDPIIASLRPAQPRACEVPLHLPSRGLQAALTEPHRSLEKRTKPLVGRGLRCGRGLGAWERVGRGPARQAYGAGPRAGGAGLGPGGGGGRGRRGKEGRRRGGRGGRREEKGRGRLAARRE